MTTPQIKRRLDNIERQLKALTPQTAPGILTNRTTQGVTRMPTLRSNAGNRTSDNGTGIAVWQ